MKTKIIYISGNEIFKASDVKNAFDEIRSALGLEQDTILFGVPVDNTDAFVGKFDNIAPIQEATSVPIEDINANDDIENISPIQQKEPIIDEKKTIKSKKKSTKKVEVFNIDNKEQDISPIPQEEAIEDKIIPITTILSANTVEKTEVPNESDIQPAENGVLDISIEDVNDSAIEIQNAVLGNEDEIISVTEFDTTENVLPDEETSIEVTDIDLSPDSPIEYKKTTLEELLDSINKLDENEISAISKETDNIDINIEKSDECPQDETDKTLEMLANEFIENQDTIINTTKNPVHGKIGKLKSILPFKKAKREDTGVLGDLFGWAGIAANDEEFSMPEFFPTTASKK